MIELVRPTVRPDASTWPARLVSILGFLAAFFVLTLAIRQGIACLWSARLDWPSPFLLFGGSILIAAFFPIESLVGAVALIPILNGLDRIGVLGATPGVSLVFSGVFLGGLPRVWKSGGAAVVTILDACIVLVGISLLWLIGERWTPENGASLWHQPLFGFAQIWMGVRAAYVLILGLAIARVLAVAHDALDEFSVTAVMVMQLASVAGFALVQRALSLPAPYYANLGGEGVSTFVPTSPGDDIHTFGSMAVACFGFFLGDLPRKKIAGVGVAVAAFLVVISFSRAAWGASAVTVVLWLWRRGYKKTITFSGLAGIACAIAMSGKANHWENIHNHFARRLILLADVSHWMAQDSARLDLYHKAFHIIEKHPLAGVGIGQFFSTSPSYARAGDPLAAEPQFAHNALLQLTAETGLPCGIVFAAFLCWITWKTRAVPPARDSMWLAFVGFSLTQLTANAVNIFDSQAAILGWALGIACLALKSPCEGPKN